MEFTYDGIVKWMEDYFKAYNAYAQNPETVNKMSEYFTPDVHFIPYVAEFGGPERAVTSRDDFFRMFTGHPAVYEKFEPEDIMVDEKKKIVVALLNVVSDQVPDSSVKVRDARIVIDFKRVHGADIVTVQHHRALETSGQFPGN